MKQQKVAEEHFGKDKGTTTSTGTAEGQDGTNNLGHVEQKPGTLQVSGMAVFRATRLIGWLNENESRGWGWICGRVSRGYILDLTPQNFQGELSPITFRIIKGKSSVKFSLDDGKVAAHLSIKVDGEMAEWYTNRDFIGRDVINNLNADMAAEIKNEVESALIKCQQELKSDIFGFGFELSRQHPEKWNQEFRY